MSNKKLKLPSLKATSRGIAEDLKAIKEALTAKPKGSLPDKKQGGKTKKQPKQVKNESDDKDDDNPSVNVERKSSSTRPQRQRKPNSRYTDLISEIQSTLRRRNFSSRSELSSDDDDSFIAEDIIEPQREKRKYTKKKEKQIPIMQKKRGRPPKARSPSPLTDESFSDSDDGFESDNSEMRHQMIQKFEANIGPKGTIEPKEKKRVPIRPKVTKVPKQQVETSGLYRGRRNPTTAGRAVRLQAAAAAAVTGTSTASVANRRPSFEGEYAHQADYGENEDLRSRHNFLARRSNSGYQSQNLAHSPPRSNNDYGVGVYYEAASSREAAAAALALSEYGTSQPVASEPASMLNQMSYESGNERVGNVAENDSPDPALSFEDQEDEVPALVYGPGPRVITYHGDYYPLSPVPAKRRMSKYPRPRSHRYKPFSSCYKAPDVMRYRRRNRRLGLDFRRQIRTLPPLGTDWSAWAMRNGAYGQPGEEMRTDGYGEDDYGYNDYEADEWTARRLGMAERDGRRMPDEEMMARGVYGELDNAYAGFNSAPTSAAHRPLVDADGACQLPPDIAGDHCYIRGAAGDAATAQLLGAHHGGAGFAAEDDEDYDDDDRSFASGNEDDDEDRFDAEEAGLGPQPHRSSAAAAAAYAAFQGAGGVGVGAGGPFGAEQDTPAAVLDLQQALHGGAFRRGPPPVTLKIGVSSVSVGGTSFADYSFSAVGRDDR